MLKLVAIYEELLFLLCKLRYYNSLAFAGVSDIPCISLSTELSEEMRLLMDVEV